MSEVHTGLTGIYRMFTSSLVRIKIIEGCDDLLIICTAAIMIEYEGQCLINWRCGREC